MRQNNILIKKQKLLETLDKIIDLKIFKLTIKIQVLEKQVGSLTKIFDEINKFCQKIRKESNFFSNYIIDKKTPIITKKNKITYAYIFLQTNDESTIGKYTDNKILEYIQKKIQQKDFVYIIGKRLFDLIDNKKENLINLNKNNLIFLNDYNNEVQKDFQKYANIFENVSYLALNIYEDMIVDKISIVYSDIKQSANLFELDILPLNFDKNINIYKNNKVNTKTNNIKKTNDTFGENVINFLNFINEKNIKLEFDSDLDLVNRVILKMLIAINIKYVIFGYLLNMMWRQMFILEDNKKNIAKNIEKIQYTINKERQEYITREMIAIATTLKNIKKNKLIDEENNKKIGDETNG